MLSTVFLIASIVVASQAAPSNDFRYPTNGRIVGGVVSDIKDFPYQVSLQDGSRHFCGGSIISKKWILSAAHCMEQMTASRLKVRVGSSFHKSDGKVVKVVKIVSHPSYNKRTIDYDYALVELAEELEFNTSVQSVDLPAQNEELVAGANCVVSGWGNTQSSLESNAQLRSVVVPVISREDCAKDYDGFNPITDRMVCAGFRTGGKDACQGDSGGPFVHNKVLVGVVSWGKGCADKNYPGVYSNVANVRDWIKKVSSV
ncbi:trypsin-1-like [Culicoides brevitarsis]|uniref:trypsin-1-like n=1 Tax=Culicoides brevitarsis TaxID=469753 RepID=UPI00307B66D4